MGKHTSRVVGAKYRDAPGWLVQQLLDRREITAEGCWLWPAYVNRDGYGVVMYTAHREDGTARRPQLMVHRLAYMRFVADLDDDQQVDHICHDPAVCLARKKDCPHRRCYNPAHLEPVAGVVNLMRSGNFAAVNAAKTHCDNDHLFDERNTAITPDGDRRCRTCMRMHAARYRAAARTTPAPPRICKGCGDDISHLDGRIWYCERCRPVNGAEHAATRAREARKRKAREAGDGEVGQDPGTGGSARTDRS